MEGKSIEKSSNKLIYTCNSLKSVTNKLLGLDVDHGKKNLTDIDYYKLSNPNFYAHYELAVVDTLKLANSLLNILAVLSRNTLSSPTKVALTHVDACIDEFDPVVEILDNVFEKIDICMDKMLQCASSADISPTDEKFPLSTSAVLQSAPMVGEISQHVDDKNVDIKIIHAKNIARPQLKFHEKIDNSLTPSVPKIKTKPNAKVPLQDIFLLDDLNGSQLNSATVGLVKNAISLKEYPHPYEYEIQHLEYPVRFLQLSEPTVYTHFEKSPYIYVDTRESFLELCQYLDSVSEFAIDLENHSYRSFQGFCCLVQISTRERDYVIDALELRSRMHLLNSSFTNPSILKVLHGSEHDILWLQRDFGLFLVNVFDTFIASKLLELSNHSLAYLLKEYCSITLDKKYQLADWRIRPLPVEMITYARKDTHYLLNLYDLMRNEILNKPNYPQKLLMAVFKKSAELCLRKYSKELYDINDSWKSTYFKYEKPLNREQMNVFKALHAWRDHLAREEDESVRYVLPNHMLLQMAEKMPSEMSAVLACCNPVPPLVRQYATDLSLLIARAKDLKEDPLSLTSQLLIEPNQTDAEDHKESRRMNETNTIISDTSAMIKESLSLTPSTTFISTNLPVKSKSKLQSLFEPKQRMLSSSINLIQSIKASMTVEPRNSEEIAQFPKTESSVDSHLLESLTEPNTALDRNMAEEILEESKEEVEWKMETEELKKRLQTSYILDASIKLSQTEERMEPSVSNTIKPVEPFVYDQSLLDKIDEASHTHADTQQKRSLFDPFAKVTEPDFKLNKTKGPAYQSGNKMKTFKSTR